MLASLAIEDWNRSVVIGDYNLQYYEDKNMAYIYNMVLIPTILKQV